MKTKLAFLFEFYECNSIEVLECRCPFSLRIIDLDSEATEEFKQTVYDLEEREQEEIVKILEKRL